MKKMHINKDKVSLVISRYVKFNNIAVAVVTEDGEDYGSLTVNLTPLKENSGAIDTDNFPGALKFIEKYKLGKITGKTYKSGFSIYPEVDFDMERLKKYEAPDDIINMMSE